MKFLRKNKKGVVDQLSALVIGLVGIAIIIVIGFLIFKEVRENSSVVADTNATIGLGKIEQATADIPDWIPIIVITIIGALLIALVAVFRRR